MVLFTNTYVCLYCPSQGECMAEDKVNLTEEVEEAQALSSQLL